MYFQVTEVNKRWQKYNQERQEYVQKLLSTIKEFQQKEQLNVNEINSKSQAETSSFLGSSDYLKYENDVLLNDLEESERRCRHLNDKLLGVKRDLNEKIELLELQVKQPFCCSFALFLATYFPLGSFALLKCSKQF